MEDAFSILNVLYCPSSVVEAAITMVIHLTEVVLHLLISYRSTHLWNNL